MDRKPEDIVENVMREIAKLYEKQVNVRISAKTYGSGHEVIAQVNQTVFKLRRKINQVGTWYPELSKTQENYLKI